MYYTRIQRQNALYVTNFPCTQYPYIKCICIMCIHGFEWVCVCAENIILNLICIATGENIFHTTLYSIFHRYYTAHIPTRQIYYT